MKKFIIITSIFSPTESVFAFSNKKDYNLIVIGDRKTPEDWKCNNTEYISLESQFRVGEYLHKVLPVDHYSRKMIGYLHAIKLNADYIIDTDDDNIPKTNWSFPEFEGTFDTIDYEGFINIYQLYTNQKIWPRGLPLNLIAKQFHLEQKIKQTTLKVGIWQGLADEDPDVDAIYRLTSDVPCYFRDREPIVLKKGTISPFNSQNTMFRKELFPLLYLPTFVTFRFTDILRGLVAQPIMWLYGFTLGFTNATVTQKRNPHDYMKDFISEIPVYQFCENVIQIVLRVISEKNSIETNLYIAYEALFKEDVVCEKELITLEAWLSDIRRK